jgi:hypothetical protein
MRLNYLLCILFLLSQGTSLALGEDDYFDIPENGYQLGGTLGCGDDYYSSRENSRFYMLNTELFVGNALDGFDYHLDEEAESTSFTENAERSSFAQNIRLWQHYTNAAVKLADIHAVIYSDTEIDGFDTDNSFINYLQNNNREEAVKYIEFAKTVSPYNRLSTSSSYWEEDKDEHWIKQQMKLYKTALARIETSKDAMIQRRYAFLAMRLAFYVGEQAKIIELYHRFFAKVEERDLLDYWAMHFLTRTIEDPIERAYLASLVFNGAADKRYISLRQFGQAKELDEVFKRAKNDQERAGIWVLRAIRENGPTLDMLKKIYTLDPGHPDFDYLVLREITKLEDWILTPEYTAYWFVEGQKEKDVNYAGELLSFIRTVNARKTDNRLALTIAEAYIQMILHKTVQARRGLKKALKLAQGQGVAEQHIQLLLFLLDVRSKSKVNKQISIPKPYQEVLMRTIGGPNVEKFPIVGDGRHHLNILKLIVTEYHKADNYIVAGLLSAKTSTNSYYRSNSRGFHHTRGAYSYIWNYDVEQMTNLIAQVENVDTEDPFNNWFYDYAKLDIEFFKDLLGSAYMRRNKLDSALMIFEELSDSVWKHSVYKNCLDANPFYTNLYKGHGWSQRFDTIVYNKEGLLRQLIEYIKLAEDPNNPMRDYYYLLVGNCYFNMTGYGNSWIMKYGLRRQAEESVDFTYAEKYYEKAARYAKTEDFKIAALAIAGRMRAYQLGNQYNWNYPKEHPDREAFYQLQDSVERSNPYLSEAKALNAEKLEILRGTCYTFDEYLLARRALQK